MTEARRQDIVRKAASLFMQKGYEAVTIDDIIGLIGGSKATIYGRFGGKDGLFESVIRQRCEDVTIAIDLENRGDLEEQLMRIGHTFLELVLSPPILEFHRLMVSIGKKFPTEGSLFYETGPQSAYAVVGKWIEKHQTTGALAPGDARQRAVLFLDMLIGEHQLASLVTLPRKGRTAAITKTVRSSVSLFLYGATPR